MLGVHKNPYAILNNFGLHVKKQTRSIEKSNFTVFKANIWSLPFEISPITVLGTQQLLSLFEPPRWPVFNSSAAGGRCSVRQAGRETQHLPGHLTCLTLKSPRMLCSLNGPKIRIRTRRTQGNHSVSATE